MSHATDATLVFMIQMAALFVPPMLVLLDEARRMIRRAKIRRRLFRLCK